MDYRKVRSEVSQCGPSCPMYYPIAALNNFIQGKGELKCPSKFCKSVISSLDEEGNLICSVSGKKSIKMEGFFEEGKFIRYDTLKEDELNLEEIDSALLEIKEEEGEEVEGENSVIDDGIEGDGIEFINNKLKLIENYFIKKLGDASYFFTQCREVDLDEKLVVFYNTKNNLISYKSIEKLPKEEQERKMLKAHEYRMPLDIFISINIETLKNKLDIFYKSLYDSLKQKEQMSCKDCRWEKAMAKGTAMDCLNCLRNERAKMPKDKRVDNYS